MLTITLIFAAAAALVNLWLAIRCGRVRAQEKILHGDGGNPLMQRRMRAQLNFAENTPIVLILFLLVEWSYGGSLWLALVALAYIVARLLHGLGMDSAESNWMRGAGVGITMLVTLGLVGAAIYAGYTTLDTPTQLPAAQGASV